MFPSYPLDGRLGVISYRRYTGWPTWWYILPLVYRMTDLVLYLTTGVPDDLLGAISYRWMAVLVLYLTAGVPDGRLGVISYRWCIGWPKRRIGWPTSYRWCIGWPTWCYILPLGYRMTYLVLYLTASVPDDRLGAISYRRCTG